MNSDVCPLPNCWEYLANELSDSIPSGASSEPVMGLFSSSMFATPYAVMEPAIKMMTRNALMGA